MPMLVRLTDNWPRNQRFEPMNEDSDDPSCANHKPVLLYDIACSYHVNVIKQLEGDFSSLVPSYTPSLIGEPVIL